MKKRSGRNLIRFFYHLLVVLVMAMPMLSGLVRVIYVQSNKNANESYYGQTINDSEYLSVTSLSDFSYGVEYQVFHPISTGAAIGNENSRVLCLSLTYNGTTYENIYFSFYKPNSASATYFYLFYTYGDFIVSDLNTVTLEFSFIYSRAPTMTESVIQSFGTAFYRIIYNDYSYLDNAFDYSIWKTMKDFTFHSDFRFTDIANGMLMTFDNNNLYIQYINFYINWVLTCAVISFAPYILLTFYHLAIGLLDKFMKKGEDL